MATPRAKPTPRTLSRPEGGAADSGTRSFFGDLQDRGHEPILNGESGTLRFDLGGGGRSEHWYVAIADGDVTVSHRRGPADTIVRADRDVFERMAQGTVNAIAAQLRGTLVVEGNLHLLMVFQRLFPGPPTSTGRPPPEVERSGRTRR